jgi:hypothetical protein
MILFITTAVKTSNPTKLDKISDEKLLSKIDIARLRRSLTLPNIPNSSLPCREHTKTTTWKVSFEHGRYSGHE